MSAINRTGKYNAGLFGLKVKIYVIIGFQSLIIIENVQTNCIYYGFEKDNYNIQPSIYGWNL